MWQTNTGYCAVCGREQPLTHKGVTRSHVQRFKQCKGSGQAPVEWFYGALPFRLLTLGDSFAIVNDDADFFGRLLVKSVGNQATIFVHDALPGGLWQRRLAGMMTLTGNTAVQRVMDEIFGY